MSIGYRLKLSKNAIKFKNTGNFTLNKSSDFSKKKSGNFLLDYYSEPLFTEVSRSGLNKLNYLLKSLEEKGSNSKENFISYEGMSSGLTPKKNINMGFHLNQIYDYDKENLQKTSHRVESKKKDIFFGSDGYSVKRKSSLRPFNVRTNQRYEKQVSGMMREYLSHYFKTGFSVLLNDEGNEASFLPRNARDPQIKAYDQSLKDLNGYLYVNFSKKNQFFTLTDSSGNCIKYLSSGAEGLKGRDKQKPFATRLLAKKISKIAHAKKIKKLTIIFNPNNRYQRWRIKPVMRTLELQNILIECVQRKVVQAHGGCRKKKSRRI